MASAPGDRQTYTIRYLTGEQCEVFLRPLGLDQITYEARGTANVLEVQGTPGQLRAAEVVLDVVDSRDAYCVETLGPASSVRALPSNRQIAVALGHLNIGTFTEPPGKDRGPRALIDIQADSVLAFLPVRYRERLRTVLANPRTATGRPKTTLLPGRPGEDLPGMGIEPTVAPSQAARQLIEPNDAALTNTEGRERQQDTFVQPPAVVTLTEMATPSDPEDGDKAGGPSSEQVTGHEPPKTIKISLSPAPKGPEDAGRKTTTDIAMPANGEDLLTMTLPETITLIQLLDLVGKHVGLHYVYDPKEIGNQSIALKLHGNLQGEMKIKNLYTLLEELIDILDVAQEDPRAPHIYTVKHLNAQQALDKLQKLEVLKSSPRGAAASDTGGGGDALTEEPLVAVLEATNQLVVKAAPDQHAGIREFLHYIDVTPTDTRTIAAYRIQHIDVHAAKETLEELDLVRVDSKASSFTAGPNQPAARQGAPVPITPPAGHPLQKAPVVVSEAARALIVKATPEEHARVAAILQYIDRNTTSISWPVSTIL